MTEDDLVAGCLLSSWARRSKSLPWAVVERVEGSRDVSFGYRHGIPRRRSEW